MIFLVLRCSLMSHQLDKQPENPLEIQKVVAVAVTTVMNRVNISSHLPGMILLLELQERGKAKRLGAATPQRTAVVMLMLLEMRRRRLISGLMEQGSRLNLRFQVIQLWRVIFTIQILLFIGSLQLMCRMSFSEFLCQLPIEER